MVYLYFLDFLLQIYSEQNSSEQNEPHIFGTIIYLLFIPLAAGHWKHWEGIGGIGCAQHGDVASAGGSSLPVPKRKSILSAGCVRRTRVFSINM